MKDDSGVDELRARLTRLEDVAAITSVILTYGLAADAGMASFAGELWVDDGEYDWDAEGEPHVGSAGVEMMLSGGHHRSLMAEGVAHFAGPPLIEVDGDRAMALYYSLIMRRELDRSYLWRVSAVRWEFERVGSHWQVRRRTNRLLDPSLAGSELFGSTLREHFSGSKR